MMTVTNTLGLLLLGLVVLPLSLLWAYSLYDSVRAVLPAATSGPSEPGQAALSDDSDFPSWPALLLLTGFFGGVAYLVLVLLPRLQRPRARLRLGTVGAA